MTSGADELGLALLDALEDGELETLELAEAEGELDAETELDALLLGELEGLAEGL